MTMTLAELRQREHWSYSSLNQLLNICSLQHFFDKIEKRPRLTTPVNLVLGTVYHHALSWIAMSRMDGNIPSESDSREMFNEIWRRQVEEEPEIDFGENDDGESCAKTGMDLCAAYIKQIDPDEQVLTIGEVFAVPVDGTDRALIGELDSRVQKGDAIHIIDWKTSGRRYSENQITASLQPTIYLYGHEQLHPKIPADFIFETAIKLKAPVVEKYATTRSQDDFRRLEALISKAESILKNGIFYPSELSMFCGGCPHKEACRAWHRNHAKTISVAA